LFVDCFCEIDIFKLFFDCGNFTIKIQPKNILINCLLINQSKNNQKTTTPFRRVEIVWTKIYPELQNYSNKRG
jgi:hypothetical protein